MNSRLCSVLLSLLTALFFFAAAIAVPILWRPFYYHQVDSLALVEQTGWEKETIQGAFDQVMDFLVWDAPFGVGELPWSNSGKEHFIDCQKLFRLDFFLLGLSAFGLAVLQILRRTKIISVHRFCNRSPVFWAFLGMFLIYGVLLLWALADFNGLFTAFHKVFFPGKTNWIFDVTADPVIRILPEAFWARAGGLVVGLSLGGTGFTAALAEFLHWRKQPRNIYEAAKLL